MIKWLLILIISYFSIAANAQEQKPVAIKLSALDYSGSNAEFSALAEKIQQFLERLSKEPMHTRGAIIIYPAFRFKGNCIDHDLEVDPEVENFVRKVVELNSDISPDRIIFISGTLSVRGSVYFWLVPSGAETPKAPESNFHPPCCCPTLFVVGSSNVKLGVKQLRFFAYMRPSLTANVLYKWTVSGGKISSGQETSEIVVDLKKSKIKKITATVEISVNPSCNCPTTNSFTTMILPQ